MASDSAAQWKDSILLPQTDFPMRADLPRREPESVARWLEEGLYEALRRGREGRPPFIFHDGPPYANGFIHHGHALNKILKDVVIKYQALAGRQITHVPGWDCHGLPIEHKVDGELGAKKEALDVTAFREHCRAWAAKWIDVQRAQFQRLLVCADWEHPYRTMDPGYVATILRTFAALVERGFVFRGAKPIHWSWAARTALAEAEVEYDVYDAPSVYVKFPFPEPPAWLEKAAGGRRVAVVIWTTTPWTLPANAAVVLHPDLKYRLEALGPDEAIIIGEDLAGEVHTRCGLDAGEVLHRFSGRELVGRDESDAPRHGLRHPFIDRVSWLLPATYVTTEQGTGCVHTAPGHGHDDYLTGLRFGLPMLAPVDDRGCFTAEASPEALVGQHVFKANPWIAQLLADRGALLNRPTDVYRVERYPHCWRTGKPLIFRATPQWFLRIDHEGMRERALATIGATAWIPPWGEKRIRGMVEVRPDWCLSRQRAWGVPIPVFRCSSCGNHVLDHRVAEHVAQVVTETNDADQWFKREPAALAPADVTCPNCGASPDAWEKGQDVLDVWFDSGVSWAAVLRDREGYDQPADLYLEGSDQHRGWFHTSLLTAQASADRAPYRAVLTHGFVVDESGRKYAKSSPNYEPLEKLLETVGADVLRLWVASVDYRGDVVLAPKVLAQAGEAYRKVRNTLRFLLGNLHDFRPDEHRLDLDQLTPIDRWTLQQTALFLQEAQEAYERYEFRRVYLGLIDLCTLKLSNVTLDVLKDRLYCSAPDDPTRRGSQAVLYEVARALTIAVAPLLSFTADEAWSFLPRRAGDPSSVFLESFPSPPEAWLAPVDAMSDMLALRERFSLVAAERRPAKKGERLPGQIGTSMEAHVRLGVPAADLVLWRQRASDLRELLIVADVEVVEQASGDGELTLELALSEHERCPRCWNHRPEVTRDAAGDLTLCGRCTDVVSAAPQPSATQDNA